MTISAPCTNDESRDLILRHLYEVHQKAKSPRTAGQSIRELQQALKPLGLKQADVAHHLDYLVQQGWVREDREERSFTTARGTRQSSERITYKISHMGIDRLEEASTYKRTMPDGGINVTNISGVTVVGSGNVVNTSFTELSRALTDARSLVLETPGVDETVKLEIVSDIDTLQGQLQKPAPNKYVVSTVWEALERTLNLAGLAELGVKIGSLIAPLLV
jgi:hypothetical protein